MKLTLKSAAAAALLLTMFSACGDPEPSYSDERVAKIAEKAPSLTDNYSEDQLVALMEDICAGDLPAEGDLSVDEQARGYIIGMALATCE